MGASGAGEERSQERLQGGAAMPPVPSKACLSDSHMTIGKTTF